MEEWEASYLAGIIDGEGSITLTRMHRKEFRRPCITIASTDIELLEYVKSITGGTIVNKKNYRPLKHKNSYCLNIVKKKEVFTALKQVSPYLRVERKKDRCNWILLHYNNVTPRNGKYDQQKLALKIEFEKSFFCL
ncbi:LAGLIDADG family homing endonuclease [Bacillus sp. FJAT-27245]|uniref:LAGLIDADG family homing endonuclease n=1 Tax=Bacillus sp. FJAT-27245 TaxID=1684144 RepID=UPI0009E95B52|nr:LAGLIDADG family homing endonuclease [Bacillus sp. FJAT-27245]